MRDYKIYFLDHNGRISLSYDFQGADYLAALDEARKYNQKSPIEIWQQSRLVARLDKCGNASQG